MRDNVFVLTDLSSISLNFVDPTVSMKQSYYSSWFNVSFILLSKSEQILLEKSLFVFERLGFLWEMVILSRLLPKLRAPRNDELNDHEAD